MQACTPGSKMNASINCSRGDHSLRKRKIDKTGADQYKRNLKASAITCNDAKKRKGSEEFG